MKWSRCVSSQCMLYCISFPTLNTVEQLPYQDMNQSGGRFMASSFNNSLHFRWAFTFINAVLFFPTFNSISHTLVSSSKKKCLFVPFLPTFFLFISIFFNDFNHTQNNCKKIKNKTKKINLNNQAVFFFILPRFLRISNSN